MRIAAFQSYLDIDRIERLVLAGGFRDVTVERRHVKTLQSWLKESQRYAMIPVNEDPPFEWKNINSCDYYSITLGQDDSLVYRGHSFSGFSVSL